MASELQRMSTTALAGLGFSPVQAQMLARFLAGANGRTRQNNALNRTGAPTSANDVKLVGIDGATTLKKGDEVSTNRSKALLRPPRISFHGGQQVRTVVRIEQERQPYFAAVISNEGDTTYMCVLLDRDPPTRVEAGTGQDTGRDQDEYNEEIADDASATPADQQVRVRVYGGSAYEENDIIAVECVRQWKVRTTCQTKLGDQSRNTVVSRVLMDEKFYSTNYSGGGGGE